MRESDAPASWLWSALLLPGGDHGPSGGLRAERLVCLCWASGLMCMELIGEHSCDASPPAELPARPTPSG